MVRPAIVTDENSDIVYAFLVENISDMKAFVNGTSIAVPMPRWGLTKAGCHYECTMSNGIYWIVCFLSRYIHICSLCASLALGEG